MPLASFLDKPGVVPGILVGYVFLLFLARVVNSSFARRRPLGIWVVVGIFVLAILMAFADWLIDDVL